MSADWVLARYAKTAYPADCASSIVISRFTAVIAMGLYLWAWGVFGAAAATGLLTSDSDIVGIRTTMTRAEAKDFIERQLGAQIFPSRIIGPPQVTVPRRSLIGFRADIAPARDVKDELDLFIDPDFGASDLLAVIRKASYGVDKEIPEPVLIQSLIAKFGEPLLTDGLQTYYWAEGIRWPNSPDWLDCSRFAGAVADLDNRVDDLIDAFMHDPPPLPKCPMYLKAQIVSVANPGDRNSRSVVSFSMALVNVGNSYAALGRYAAQMKDSADAEARNKPVQESQNKPRL